MLLHSGDLIIAIYQPIVYYHKLLTPFIHRGCWGDALAQAWGFTFMSPNSYVRSWFVEGLSYSLHSIALIFNISSQSKFGQLNKGEEEDFIPLITFSWLLFLEPGKDEFQLMDTEILIQVRLFISIHHLNFWTRWHLISLLCFILIHLQSPQIEYFLMGRFSPVLFICVLPCIEGCPVSMQ